MRIEGEAKVLVRGVGTELGSAEFDQDREITPYMVPDYLAENALEEKGWKTEDPAELVRLACLAEMPFVISAPGLTSPILTEVKRFESIHRGLFGYTMRLFPLRGTIGIRFDEDPRFAHLARRIQ